MNFAKFTIYTVLGCLPWTFALGWLGYILGDNWTAAENVIRPVAWAYYRHHHRWRVVGRASVAARPRGVRRA